IIAHDGMHGSLAPGRRWLNQSVGQLCLGVYAGFSFRKLDAEHHRHHRAPGSTEDPDFHAEAPRAFWPWYVKFFRTYFGWRELMLLATALAVYLFVFRVSPLNAALFWGLPAILSSLQLFAFGTWLPHRHKEEGAFADRHRARTLDYPWLVSLLTCFHFGYHHEHHEAPHVPWWGLPATRVSQRSGRA
ncbi:MAG: fatty acid desaturase, partial [Methylobacteriaceae bacterium]|nr:fatty acid desaturase [Methylobacteriaceae bacterium]